MSRLALADGAVVREASQAKVYQLQGTTKVWIPTPSAVAAIGYGGGNPVRIVPDGSLAAYAECVFQEQEPSNSAQPQTPGSLVFPPPSSVNPPSRHQVAPVSTAWRVTSRGRDVRILTLQGWLYPADGIPMTIEDEWDDWHYRLEIDSRWAADTGIDLNEIIRVGNIVEDGIQKNGSHADRYAVCALPLVELEINAWKPGNTRGAQCPADWTFPDASPAGQDFLAHVPLLDPPYNQALRWPWNPRLPLDGGPDDEARAPYVRVAGSVITDIPHRRGDLFGGASWAWAAGRDSSAADNPARRTEIHPPDMIGRLTPRGRLETFRGVAVVAGNGVFEGPSTTLDAEIPAPPKPPPRPDYEWRLRVVEELGSETNPGTVKEHDLQLGATAAHLHVVVERTGIRGTPGKFKAIYRLYWEEHWIAPPPPLMTARIVQPRRLPPALARPISIQIEALDSVTRAAVPGATIVIVNPDGRNPAPFEAGVVASVTLRSRRIVDRGTGDVTVEYPGCTVRAPRYEDLTLDLGFPDR